MKPGLEFRDLGLLPYSSAYTLQKACVEDRIFGRTDHDVVLLVEHEPVYTVGRKGQRIEGSAPDELLVKVERGGEATYHNPGQLVAYPIMKLAEGERDLHQYLRKLEEVVIRTLHRFDLRAERRPGATGVWVDNHQRKIASIGVAVSSWITYHGIALNVCNDLKGFSQINPCGFDSSVMTSIEKEHGMSPKMEEVKEEFKKQFRLVFDRD